MSTPEPWSGASGLRIETLDPGGDRPWPAATVVVSGGAGGEPLWLSPAQWSDLCQACAELGPGYAPELPSGAALAEPASAAAQVRPPA